MAKKKNAKKKQQQQKKDTKELAVKSNNRESILAEDEDEDDCGESIRSDGGTHPSSDDNTLGANGEDEVIGDIKNIDCLPSDQLKHMKKRRNKTWNDLRDWWEGECSPFARIMNDLMFDMNRCGSESAMLTYKIIQQHDEATSAIKRKEAKDFAHSQGVKPLPKPSSRLMTYPEPPEYTEEELSELIYKWQLKQDSYLPSGKFNNLEIGRWEKTDEDKLKNPSEYYKFRNVFQGNRSTNNSLPRGPIESDRSSDTQPTSPLPSQSNPKNANDYIKIQLYSPDGLTTIVSLKWSTRMIKLKEKHSTRLGRPVKSLIYRFKGKNLRDSDTVKTLGMVDNDIIHVHDAVPSRRH